VLLRAYGGHIGREDVFGLLPAELILQFPGRTADGTQGLSAPIYRIVGEPFAIFYLWLDTGMSGEWRI
jgi:hypothetical protein